MKYEQSYTEFDHKILEMIESKIPGSFADELSKSGAKFAIPHDQEVELKVKYDIQEGGGAFSLKFSWDDGLDKEDYED